MKSRCIYLILLAGLCPLYLSCLWDRDTLAEEAKGKASEVNVLIGWFDRYPAEYYELRLKRVRKTLKEQPDNLDLYDDAAVALDRLHKSDEAISVMLEKGRRLSLLEESKLKAEHQYRYLANLGTFYAHRWIGRPRKERESDYADLIQAEKLISDAIELNPEAHFGRETYQLMAIRWLIPKNDPSAEKEYRGQISIVEDRNMASSEAVEGLLGLVRLGSAWKSIDIHAALAGILSEQEHASLALIARLRYEELASSGSESLHYDAEVRGNLLNSPMESLRDENPVREWYQRARETTKSRNALRELYILERLEKGEHPDTHPDFWASWREFDLPEMPSVEVKDKDSLLMEIGVLAVCALLGVTIVFVWWAKRMSRKHTERIPFVLD